MNLLIKPIILIYCSFLLNFTCIFRLQIDADFSRQALHLVGNAILCVNEYGMPLPWLQSTDCNQRGVKARLSRRIDSGRKTAHAFNTVSEIRSTAIRSRRRPRDQRTLVIEVQNFWVSWGRRRLRTRHRFRIRCSSEVLLVAFTFRTSLHRCSTVLGTWQACTKAWCCFEGFRFAS